MNSLETNRQLSFLVLPHGLPLLLVHPSGYAVPRRGSLGGVGLDLIRFSPTRGSPINYAPKRVKKLLLIMIISSIVWIVKILESFPVQTVLPPPLPHSQRFGKHFLFTSSRQGGSFLSYQGKHGHQHRTGRGPSPTSGRDW